MNAVKKLAIVLSLGVLVGSAFAATSEKAYVSAYADVSGDYPVPVKVVAPQITTSPGAEVVLKFIVNKAGVPKAITVASSNDDALAAAAVKAVAEWRFTPAMKDGETIETKVKLPVRAELPTFGRGRYAFVY